MNSAEQVVAAIFAVDVVAAVVGDVVERMKSEMYYCCCFQ